MILIMSNHFSSLPLRHIYCTAVLICLCKSHVTLCIKETLY